MSSLKHNTLRWPLIGMLGVSIVVAGQFSGWNFGLSHGWLNFAAALVIMCVFYACFCQILSEMAATWPSAGGLARYCRLAYGPRVGGLVSVSISMALIGCTGIVGTFIAAYAESVLGLDGMLVRIVLFGGILLIHLIGTKEAMWFVLLTGGIAVITLIVFCLTALPSFSIDNLALEATGLSLSGIVGALPFALWMYIALEQAVCASEEAHDPSRDVPRGLLMGLVVLSVTATGVLISATGTGGVDVVAGAADPLVAALDAAGATHPLLAGAIGIGAILGLIASFFSISYSASRQFFDLSRSGFLPVVFSRVNGRGVPVPAVMGVVALGFLLSFPSPDQLLLVIVLLFTATYLLTAIAYLVLHRKLTGTPRQYHAIGGVTVGWITVLLSALIFYACFDLDATTLAIIGAVFALALLHRRLVRVVPEIPAEA